MRVAIMQPYFLPYIGYFQLINAVDIFVVYDNVKYTKRGWINRNRMLLNGAETLFSLPLQNGSDLLTIAERELAPDFRRHKLLDRFKGAYARAPHFRSTFDLMERVVLQDERNLFKYVHRSIVYLCEYLSIDTEIRTSSSIAIDSSLRSQDRVIAICHALGADSYVNAIGGVGLYSHEDFRSNGIDLFFLETKLFNYVQFEEEFVPRLSIIDLMMFSPINKVRGHIGHDYQIVGDDQFTTL